MIIEFSGLPGTGKSTIARRLVGEKNIQRIRIDNKYELIWYNLLFLIKHPIKFIVRLIYVFRNSVSFKMFYFKFMNVFLNTNAKFEKATKYDLALLDQGFMQSVGSIFEREVTEEEIKTYSKYLLFPDLLIFFEAPYDVLDSRIEKRGHFTRPFLTAEYLKKWKEVVRTNFVTFKKLFPSLPCKVKIVDANRDIDEVFLEITNNLDI